MISLKVKKEDVPKIPLSNKDRYRAEYLDMRDTTGEGGLSEWVQSFVASTAHDFFGKGALCLGWEHVFKFVAGIYNFGEGLCETLSLVEEITLTDEDIEKYKLYLKYINYLKEDYFVEGESCSYINAYKGKNVRGRLFNGYIIGVDEDLEDKMWLG